MEKDYHRKQSEKWDAEYKRVYPCEGRWEGEDHLEGLGEGRPGMARLMDIMWPIRQSHFHVSCLCSLK